MVCPSHEIARSATLMIQLSSSDHIIRLKNTKKKLRRFGGFLRRFGGFLRCFKNRFFYKKTIFAA